MLGQNDELKPSGSDIGGLLADLLEGARRRNLSANSLAAYERTWRAFLAWAAAAGLDPRVLSFPTAPEAYRFLGEGKNAANLKQIRAALSFAYRHWRVFQNGGWPMKSTGYRFSAEVEITENRARKRAPNFDQGETVRISPRFEMLSSVITPRQLSPLKPVPPYSTRRRMSGQSCG